MSKADNFGMSEKQIRRMQAEVKKKVDDNIIAKDEEREAAKKDSEFREAQKHMGMDKGDLGRSSRSRK